MFNTFLNLVFDGGINQQFFMVMSIIFMISLICLFLKKGASFVDYTPSLLTSIGIFGTFLGIFFGLLEFNPTTIDKSIETLLTGLKTAFVTSLIGLVLSMLFKTIHTIYESRLSIKNQEDIPDGDITPNHIHSALQTQNKILAQMSAAMMHSGENSIISQLKLLRNENSHNHQESKSDLIDFQNKLWLKLDEFSEILAKSATETIIDALKSVIEDFNKNLTDQFGENFKQLNEAVFRLVQWQDNHLEEMNRLLELHKQNSDSVQIISDSTQEIAKSMHKAVDASNSLEAILKVNQHQISQLSDHLGVFATMRDKAVEALPTIHQQLEDVTTQLVDGASNVNEIMMRSAGELTNVTQTMVSTVTHSSEAIATKLFESTHQLSQSLIGASNQILGKLEGAADNATRVTTHFNSTMDRMIERFETTLKSTLKEFEKAQNEISDEIFNNSESVLKAINEHTKLNVDKTTEAMNIQFVTFEQTMKGLLQQLESTHNAVLRDFENSQNSISHSVNHHTETVLNQMQSQVMQSVDKTTSAINSQVDHLEVATQNMMNEFSIAVKSMIQDIQATQMHLSQNALEHNNLMLKDIEGQIKNTVNTTNEAINRQLKHIDSALEHSLNQALDELGSALGSIAKHLIKIYEAQANV